MTRRVVLVGATGAFGERLARLLAPWPQIELILAARGLERAQALADELGCVAAGFDRDRPETLRELRPWAVIDAAGPFQHSAMLLPRAAIALGAHYIDIADGRDFVAGFAAALDVEARSAGVLAVTGASSTPALSNAALDALTVGWTRLERVTVAISPGARAPRGLSVVRAILSYVGRPVRVFSGGRWGDEAGWSGLRRIAFPGLGRRLGSLCETPDLDLMAGRVEQEARFLAGLELAPLHLGLWLMSWLVRLRVVRSLEPAARPLRAVADLAAGLGSDRGDMVVLAEGRGADGAARRSRWSLAAQANAGPTVPVAAAAAVLRGLVDGRVEARGAQACVGLVTLDDIVGELAGLPITTRADSGAPEAPTLLQRLLGDATWELPAPVVAVHDRTSRQTFSGRGVARGARGLLARLSRAGIGLPETGRYRDLKVTIAPDAGGERWTRDFGSCRFSSRLQSLAAPGEFEERVGPLSFRFQPVLRKNGFAWRMLSWRLGPLPLPKALGPQVRATSFARDGVYRFSVVTAHPWLGVIFAYSGRLAG
ncbi:MAG: DUF4166 domain-containing protein [Phenylobacterium sp.]|nr:DUF4166 domain-containing protein [Phenylobacterium sp.]